MSKQVPDRLTPIPLDEFLVAAWGVWLHRLSGSPPPIHAIEIIAAHWALETGWGKSCHCWNVGNRKAVAGGVIDWTFFACGEELPKAAAEAAAKSDNRVIIKREYVSGGRAFASVKVFPDHPWCCFGAFDTLDEGIADHLELLYRRFPMAFTAAMHGDPRAFAVELKRARYYTADVDQYTRTLLGCMPRVKDTTAKINWAECPVLGPAEAERVDGIIALSAQTTEDLWGEMHAERDRMISDAETE